MWSTGTTRAAAAALGLAALLFLLLPPAGLPSATADRRLADTPWPKYRGDLRATGRSAHVGPRTDALRWRFSTGRTGETGGIETDPVIGPDGTVYFGANSGIFYGLDPETGDIRWVFPAGFDTFAIYSTPFVDRQGLVYFGAKDGHVYALRPPGQGILGEVVWSYDLGTTIQTSPTFTPDGTLVIGADDWAYYGITPPRDGRPAMVKWRFQTQGTLITSPTVDADGTVYVASMDGTVYALEPPAEAGGPVTVRWRFSSGQRDAEGGFENAAVLDGRGGLYTGGNDGVLYALETRTGDVRWTFDGVARAGYTSYAIFSSVAIGPDGVLYFGGKDGVLYALRERRGLLGRRAELVWRYKLAAGIQSSPLVDADGTVYIADEQGTLHAVRRPGRGAWAEALWTFRTDGTVISSPAVGEDGTLYTASMDGKAYAFHDRNRGPSRQGPLTGTWYGTYRDPDHTGPITLVLVQRGEEIQGAWRVQGAAWGPLEGTVKDRRGRGLFTITSKAEACPGRGQGRVRVEDDRLFGEYDGHDCRGKIRGTFEVQR
jgi:outer membrane protein assembly factor BamB